MSAPGNRSSDELHAPVSDQHAGAAKPAIAQNQATHSPAPDEPWNEEYHFSHSNGSGVAATLAFFRIVVAGALLYEGLFLLRHPMRALLASPHLAWQFFLPVMFALVLHLPTDGLTKTLGWVARGFAVFALAALAT